MADQHLSGGSVIYYGTCTQLRISTPPNLNHPLHTPQYMAKWAK